MNKDQEAAGQNGETESGDIGQEMHALMERHGVKQWCLVFDHPQGGAGFQYIGDIVRICFWLDAHAKFQTSKILTAMHMAERAQHEFREKLMGKH